MKAIKMKKYFTCWNR